MTDTSDIRNRVAPITILGAFLMVMAIFLEPMAIMMGPLALSWDRYVAADNMTTVVLAGIALIIRANVAFRDVTHLHKHVLMHRLGELSLIVGLVLHRGFWVPWRVAREYEAQTFANWWESGPVFLTTIGQSFWWLGCVLICAPQLAQWMPRTWPYAVAAFIPSLWLISYQAVDLVAMAFL